jgi:peptidoglycan/LPS O-acetylase OafA/YrhL
LTPQAASGDSPAAHDRLDCIDGLRGWAAMMVVLSHLWGQFARHLVPAYGHPLLRAISDGHIAVLIFFVLSGVALSLRFVRKPQPVPLLGMVAARYVRLVVPILATTLIVCLLLWLGIAGSPEAARLGRSEIFLGARHDLPTSLYEALTFSLYSVLFDYDPQTTFNSSLWTMPVEFKGSLIVFALLFAFSHLPRAGRRARLIAMCALTVAAILLSKQLAACFIAGYALAELLHASRDTSKWSRLASLLFITASVGLYSLRGEHDDNSGTLLAIGIVAAGLFFPAARRVLSSAPSRWLGRLSFPLYLIHVPVIACSGWFYLTLRQHSVAADVATHSTVLIALIACIVAAELLMPVERASIRLSRAVGKALPLPRGVRSGPPGEP